MGLAVTAVACSTASIAQQPAGATVPPPAALHIAPRHDDRVRIPDSIRAEHERIHVALVSAGQAPGRVGAAARELARVLHPHFEREEQIALPPLGLLVPLAAGEFSPEMQSVLPMTDALRDELQQILREHADISVATRRLEQVAVEAGQPDVERLARELSSHAKSEEEVFYPAAILVGEVVRARAEDEADRAAE
jgi:hypothetical protein